jgi:hypothetical protein
MYNILLHIHGVYNNMQPLTSAGSSAEFYLFFMPRTCIVPGLLRYRAAWFFSFEPQIKKNIVIGDMAEIEKF